MIDYILERNRGISRILLKGVLKIRFPVFHKISPLFARFLPADYWALLNSLLDTPLKKMCKTQMVKSRCISGVKTSLHISTQVLVHCTYNISYKVLQPLMQRFHSKICKTCLENNKSRQILPLLLERKYEPFVLNEWLHWNLFYFKSLDACSGADLHGSIIQRYYF